MEAEEKRNQSKTVCVHGEVRDDTDASDPAATSNAGDLLGHSDVIGSIKPEKSAEIVAVSGDPLKNIKLLEDFAFVMKEGKVYKGAGSIPRRQ